MKEVLVVVLVALSSSCKSLIVKIVAAKFMSETKTIFYDLDKIIV